MLNTKHFEIVYILHHLYIMYSNIKTPPVALLNYQPAAWVLFQRVIDQSKADIFIKPGIIDVVRWGTIDLFPGSANFSKASQLFYYHMTNLIQSNVVIIFKTGII